MPEGDGSEFAWVIGALSLERNITLIGCALKSNMRRTGQRLPEGFASGRTIAVRRNGRKCPTNTQPASERRIHCE